MGLDVTKKILLEGRDAAGTMLHSLAGVVNDLWGMASEPDPKAPAPSVQPAQPAPVTEPATPAQPTASRAPALPFDTLWKVADETVDWTEALVKDRPADGCSENLWTFYHAHAEGVLRGEIDDYLEVLEAANPLGDLRPYAKKFEVGAEDADTLMASFECDERYTGASEAELRRYLAGVALRVARDLMALLPVRQVKVYGQRGGENLLIVTWPREALQKVRFGFVDPVALAEECDAQFGA